MENVVTIIDKVYESMLVSTSILVCSSPAELGHLVTILQGKCYPCIFASSSVDLREQANKMIVTLAKEFHHQDFWDMLEGVRIDCIFFTNRNNLLDSIGVSVQQAPSSVILNVG